MRCGAPGGICKYFENRREKNTRLAQNTPRVGPIHINSIGQKGKSTACSAFVELATIKVKISVQIRGPSGAKISEQIMTVNKTPALMRSQDK